VGIIQAPRASLSRQAFDYFACHLVENRHLATLRDETASRLLGFGNAGEPYRFAFPVNLNPKDCIRRFGAKPRKNFVDDQAARPSSWKTSRMAVWMAW
jgi:hypothetical protein